MILDGAFPDSLTDPMVKALMEEYFRSSNASNPKHPDEASEEGFARLFTKDGVYQLASKKAQGHDEIVKMRKALFAHIPHREHRGVKLFTFGSNQRELMAEGEVDYGHHHGHETKTVWAARYSLTEQGGECKFSRLHIIVVGDNQPLIELLDALTG